LAETVCEIEDLEPAGREIRLRGNFKLDVYGFNISAAYCGKSGFYASNESYVCPLSYGAWQVDVLPEAAIQQMKGDIHGFHIRH